MFGHSAQQGEVAGHRDMRVHANEGSWKNPKHRQRWRATLNTYILPVRGQELYRAAFIRLILDANRPQHFALGAFNFRVAEPSLVG